MMARLIDADALMKELHEGLDGSGYDEDYKDVGIDDFILNQPTAYNVEKVVEELEEAEHRLLENSSGFGCTIGIINSMKKALDIVRKGGVE